MSFKRTPALDAFKTVIGSKHAAIPKRGDVNSRLSTPVKPTIHNSFTFGKDSRVFTIGSCFARNIEDVLSQLGFDLEVFKFSVPKEELYHVPAFPEELLYPQRLLNKYTPFSMVNEVASAFGELNLEKSLVEVADDRFLDLQLHTNMPVTIERAIERRKYIDAFNRKGISEADVIVITLGLVETWYDTLSGIYANEAPTYKIVQQYPERFEFEILSPAVVEKTLTQLIELLAKYGQKSQRVLLTVSPVPLGRSFSGNDVLIANSYSKSVQRTFAEQLSVQYDHVDYVPTYEAITLGERNLTWDKDNIHVQAGSVKSIINHVIESYLEK